MHLNPLQWTPSQFIVVYAIVGFLAVSVLIVLRYGTKPAENKELNLLELAYLAGGHKRMVETFLTGLLISKALTWSADGHSVHIRIKDQAGVGSIPLVREFVRGNAMSQLEFRKKLRWLANRIQSDLEQKGYFRTPPEARTLRPLALPLFGAALILGMTKASDGHFYAFILVTLVLIGLWSIPTGRNIPARTALKEYRDRAALAARAPLDSELPLAVALSGVKALSGTGYDVLYAEANGGGWTSVAYREGVAGEDGFVLD